MNTGCLQIERGRPGLDAEAHEIALAAIDETGLDFSFEQRIAGVEVAQLHLPGMLALG